MLVKFTDDENQPVLVDTDSIVVVIQAKNDENIRLINVYGGTVRGLVKVPVKDSIDDILQTVNSAMENLPENTFV